MIKNNQKEKKTKTEKNKKNSAQERNELDLEKIRLLLDKIENNTQEVRQLLFRTAHKKSAQKLEAHKKQNQDQKINVIEGVFDGYQMIDSKGNRYRVPENYASKSKLVEGDILKLTIGSDGTYIFKQIGPIERKKVIGVLGEKNNKYFVKVDDKKYNILTASVTYFKAKAGDKLTIIIPKNKESQWAAVENVIGVK